MESIRENLGNTIQNVGSILDGGNLAQHIYCYSAQRDPQSQQIGVSVSMVAAFASLACCTGFWVLGLGFRGALHSHFQVLRSHASRFAGFARHVDPKITRPYPCISLLPNLYGWLSKLWSLIGSL